MHQACMISIKKRYKLSGNYPLMLIRHSQSEFECRNIHLWTVCPGSKMKNCDFMELARTLSFCIQIDWCLLYWKANKLYFSNMWNKFAYMLIKSYKMRALLALVFFWDTLYILAENSELFNIWFLVTSEWPLIDPYMTPLGVHNSQPSCSDAELNLLSIDI